MVAIFQGEAIVRVKALGAGVGRRWEEQSEVSVAGTWCVGGSDKKS